ncbi:phage tail family protein [Sporosarcina sp. E16_3]|uniref:phage tail family protein n=1 Tax=Sporosarcina sp. E16_3 TaxID=2789293 RepID=UPI001A93008B|nr:phage tail family protein [Sporosarcina sp. E16_3]MBO0602695.1 phage tail family protein [Sporosarcina sp. E16_3]
MVSEYLEFTNSRGDTIRLGDANIGLVSVEGLGDVGAEIQTHRSPFQDGATFVDALLEPRYVQTELIVRGGGYNVVRSERKRLTGVVNPKLGVGVLRYVADGEERQIMAIAESVPYYPDAEGRGERWQRALVTFVCPSPFWQDVNPTIIKLQDFVGNFFFPISFPASFSIRGDEENLLNTGDVPTPINVTFRGESVNPVITKVSTGEFIRINRTIPAEHSLIITTGFNEKSVKIIDPYGVESNAMGYIDLNSTFMSLDVGENKLSFITDGGSPEVFVEYRNLFLGV